MNRKTLRRTLRRVYWLLGLVLVICFVAKSGDHIPGLAGSGVEKVLKDGYELLRDMSLLIATAGVAYITNVFQKRNTFVDALRQEWREIVQTKSALFAYTHIEQPAYDDYIVTFCKLSETIDNMRTVYRNVGETADLVGLYPFTPLHDMRRVLQTLDPRKHPDVTAEERGIARDAILQSFYALRETFLEELDLEEPDTPMLIFGGKRMKKSGATEAAVDDQELQRKRQNKRASTTPEIDALLERLFMKEHTTAKPWREVQDQHVNGAAKGEPLT